MRSPSCCEFLPISRKPLRTKRMDPWYWSPSTYSSITHSSQLVATTPMCRDRRVENQVGSTHTLQCCSAVRRNGVLARKATWANPEGSERAE